jgi:chemotaxis signal transduction protein
LLSLYYPNVDGLKFMATVSSLRTRRFANRVAETTQPFIRFRLRQDWFALPLTSVQRVAALNGGDRNSNLSQLNVTVIDQQDLKLIDVDRRIFAGIGVLSNSADPLVKDQCLVVLQSSQGELLGLPIDSRPELCRISANRIITVPSNHPTYHSLRCVSAMAEATADIPPLLFLDLEQLCST